MKVDQAIADFKGKMDVHNDKMEKGIQGLSGDVGKLQGEIQTLKDELGNQEISETAQAALTAVDDRAGKIADSIGALDDLTPPAVPTVPATT